VPYLGGEIRLGPEQRAQATDDPAVFACGDLRVRLIEHNFATVTVQPARPGYAQTSTRHSAVILRTSGDGLTARPGEPVRYAAFVAPKEAADAVAYRRFDTPGLWGFSVQLAGRPLAVALNPSDQPQTLRLAWPEPIATVYGGAGARSSAQRANGVIDLRVKPESALLVTP